MKSKTLLFTAVEEVPGISTQRANELCSEIATRFENSAALFSSQESPHFWTREYTIRVQLADAEREEALLRDYLRAAGFSCYTNNGHT
ncbi:MAG: hypothetical protein Q7R64_02670 [bacterium]|nr:hypothetical protein [bacterium]